MAKLSTMDVNVSASITGRSAIVDLSSFYAETHAVSEEKHNVKVLDLFQVIEAADCAYPVFVCEFENGKVCEIPTYLVQFTGDANEGQ